MIYLKHQDIDIETALKTHADYFYSVAIKKLGLNFTVSESNYGNREFYNSCNKIQNPHKFSKFRELKEWLSNMNRIERIIISEPKDLIKINNDFKLFVDEIFGNDTYKLFETPKKDSSKKLPIKIVKFFENLSAIFNYDILGLEKAYTSYTLTRNLGIRTCVYCNISYILTQTKYGTTGERDGGRIMNPQLDHYFPQSKYPLLQVSFFNLIPSCDICNSRVKRDFEFNFEKHTHPYQSVKPDFKFSYRPRFVSEGEGSHVFFIAENDECKKAKLTAEAMLTDRIYEAHQYEIEDLIKLKKAYSSKYLDTLQSFFPGTNFDEVYRLIVGTEMSPENFHKRPFSKFNSDILHELRKEI